MNQSPYDEQLKALVLGKTTQYPQHYDANQLQSVPRALNREALGLSADTLPFHGGDIWTGYELSWLDKTGKPQVAIGEFILPFDSPNLIESKSFKLYLNSFNQSGFDTWEQVRTLLCNDLSLCAGSPVSVTLSPLRHFSGHSLTQFEGVLLDDLPINIDHYQYNAQQLQLDTKYSQIVDEIVASDLLKSNCLITGQPDWGSIQIHYQGPRIDHTSLLGYLISFRQHNEFHEQCVERIFTDIMAHCQPQKLTVYARYTRRGGLDINPFRSNFEELPNNCRLARQ